MPKGYPEEATTYEDLARWVRVATRKAERRAENYDLLPHERADVHQDTLSEIMTTHSRLPWRNHGAEGKKAGKFVMIFRLAYKLHRKKIFSRSITYVAQTDHEEEPPYYQRRQTRLEEIIDLNLLLEGLPAGARTTALELSTRDAATCKGGGNHRGADTVNSDSSRDIGETLGMCARTVRRDKKRIRDHLRPKLHAQQTDSLLAAIETETAVFSTLHSDMEELRSSRLSA